MGSNPKQAFGLVLFLIGWTAVAAGMSGGGMIWTLLGLAVVASGIVILLKAKALEEIED